MRQTTGTRKSPGEKNVKDVKRATRKHYSSEEKIRIVLVVERQRFLGHAISCPPGSKKRHHERDHQFFTTL